MDRNIDVLKYLPSIIQEFKEFKAIADGENPEVVVLFTVLEDVLNDMFVNDATENGVKRWETILKIVPKGTDTLNVRKFRVLARINQQLPYTQTTLEQQLATLCGEDGYSLEINHGAYILKVRVALTVKGQFDEVDSLLKKVRPGNMTLDFSLLYNQHSTLANFTHAQLAAYTHDQLRNEVIS